MFYFTHKDQAILVTYLDDKRLLSSIYYISIALSNALHTNLATGPWPKINESNYVFDWVAKNRGNYEWAVDLLEFMVNEYEQRFNAKHKASSYIKWFRDNNVLVPSGAMTDFPVPEEYYSMEFDKSPESSEEKNLLLFERIVQEELSPSSWWGLTT